MKCVCQHQNKMILVMVFACLKLTLETPEQCEIRSILTIKTPERRH